MPKPTRSGEETRRAAPSGGTQQTTDYRPSSSDSSAAQGQESSVVDDLLDAIERLAQEDALIVVHPKNNTPELREAVHATPKAELWVSKFVSPGVSLVINPALIEDMKLVVPRV